VIKNECVNNANKERQGKLLSRLFPKANWQNECECCKERTTRSRLETSKINKRKRETALLSWI
jgi:hypothetical protein